MLTFDNQTIPDCVRKTVKLRKKLISINSDHVSILLRYSRSLALLDQCYL